MSKEFPIIFSTAMVNAIVDNRKTVTRRIIKGEALKWLASDMFQPAYVADTANHHCKYGYAGDTLWVRETYNSYNESSYGNSSKEIYLYKANGTDRNCTWKPSIYMPKVACRLYLNIIDVRIERLHDITEDQAKAEGIHFDKGSGYWFAGDMAMADTALHCFQELWIKINGKESWDSNPWVWVIEFKKISK